MVRVRLSRPVRRFRPLPKKTMPGRGSVIAIVGADGSGKTTLARDLTRWLGWKFDVRRLYFGIPKGSALVWMLRKARGLARRLPGGEALAQFLDRRLWLLVARRRVALHRDAVRTASGGTIVIAERYPLPELWDMSEPMDGPRIPENRPGHERERALYDAIAPPDLILVLDADLETLRAREAGLRIDIHEQKARVVSRLGAHPKAHVIDARRPYDEVLLEAKRAVWRRL